MLLKFRDPGRWLQYRCPSDSVIRVHLGLSKQQDNYAPIGDGSLVDTGFWHVPGMQPQNWNEGVRFHTFLGQLS